MRRVVSLMHRQAVKAKAEGLYFQVRDRLLSWTYAFHESGWSTPTVCSSFLVTCVQVSTLDMFKSILADQKTFPREQPYKDLVNLINFILRQFFKALADDSFLAIEVRSIMNMTCREYEGNTELFHLGVLSQKPRPLEGLFQLGAWGKN